jgi:hypothetical protein
MTFVTPLWLLGLVPLAAVVVYMLLGRRQQQAVPFLDLWRGPVKGPRPKRQLALPPATVALAILAMLLAVVGAAGPGAWDEGAGAQVTVILDRGATMSAGSRYVDTARAVDAELSRLRVRSPVFLHVVPGAPQVPELGQWVERAMLFPPTALDTTSAVNQSVVNWLRDSNGPVVMLTDRPLSVTDERVVHVAPAAAVRNVGVTLVAAREEPVAQVMVRVRNDADAGRTELRVTSADRETVRPIDLPPRGETRDYFVDVETLGDAIRVRVTGGDDFSADDAAWLAREGSRGRIEPRAALPAELRRMVDVYSLSRPPAGDAAPVALVREASALPAQSAGVVAAEAREAAAASAVEVRPHPVTWNSRWSFREPVRLAPPPPQDWTPLVTIGGRTAIAARETPARQVWVGIESDEWSRTADYVVFWANVFDWVGGGDLRFAAHAAAALGAGWRAVEQPDVPGVRTSPAAVEEYGLWPGLYERPEDGLRRAVNAGEVRFPQTGGGDWRRRLSEVVTRHARRAARPLAPATFLAATACAAAAALLWQRQRPAPASAAPAAT